MEDSRIRPTMQTRNINPCKTVGESCACMKSGSLLRGVVQRAMVTSRCDYFFCVANQQGVAFSSITWSNNQ